MIAQGPLRSVPTCEAFRYDSRRRIERCTLVTLDQRQHVDFLAHAMPPCRYALPSARQLAVISVYWPTDNHPAFELSPHVIQAIQSHVDSNKIE